MFASTGNVVLPGMLAATAARPSWSFSRAIVNRISSSECTGSTPDLNRDVRFNVDALL
jgi:hypothetical protein